MCSLQDCNDHTYNYKECPISTTFWTINLYCLQHFTLAFFQFIILQHTTKWLCEWVDGLFAAASIPNLLRFLWILTTAQDGQIDPSKPQDPRSFDLCTIWCVPQGFIGVSQEFWPTSYFKRSTKKSVSSIPHVCGDEPIETRINNSTYWFITEDRLWSWYKVLSWVYLDGLISAEKLVKSSWKICGSVPGAHCFARSCVAWFNACEDNLHDLEWNCLRWVHWKETLPHK